MRSYRVELEITDKSGMVTRATEVVDFPGLDPRSQYTCVHENRRSRKALEQAWARNPDVRSIKVLSSISIGGHHRDIRTTLY